MQRRTGALGTLALAALIGCGDDGDSSLEDAGTPPDAARDAPAPQDTGLVCPPAIPLSVPSDRVEGTLSGLGENDLTSCTAAGAFGPEAWYQLTLDEPALVILDLDSEADLVLAIRSDCHDVDSELACNDDREMGDPRPRIRSMLPAGTYYVLVDAAGGEVGGAYTLDVDVIDALPGGTCETAEPVIAGIYDDQRLDTVDLTSFDCDPHPAVTDRTVRYYSVHVPALTRLRVTAVGDTAPMHVFVRDRCEATSCLGTLPVPRDIALFLNTEDVAKDVVVAVTYAGFGSEPAPLPRYRMTVSLEPFVTHGRCSEAVELVDGTVLTEDTSTVPAFDSVACLLDAGPEFSAILHYRATVPPGMELRVRAETTSTGLAAPVVRTECGATAACLTEAWAGRGRDLGDPGHVRWQNTGTAPQEVIVSIGDLGFIPGPMTVEARIVPPTADRCDVAPVLSPGERLIAESMPAGATTETACGLDRAYNDYAFDLPAGATVDAYVAAVPGLEPIAHLSRGCPFTDCLGSDTTFRSSTRTIRYTNEGTATERVFLSVGGTGREDAFYETWFELDPPEDPYTVETIPSACVDASGGLRLDAMHPPFAMLLPFELQFFGRPMVVVYPSPEGTVLLGGSDAHQDRFGIGGLEHAVYPSTASPNGVVAALHGRFDLPNPETHAYVVATGAPPDRRFVVSWHMRLQTTLGGGTATFQAHLLENGTIELHYCDIDGDVSRYGVGIEDPEGLHAAVPPGPLADPYPSFRFTPRSAP